ncbi:hypothetical protein AGLY_008673 [Aphis glycines]|uniref:Uncharacterized protein n=1 Tax=Aphis glycines TaxID=307491 RepID=A0A6G0TKN4_APHGL|nr:hypothetical protein AGLY_008673 [Aphis glycines]
MVNCQSVMVVDLFWSTEFNTVILFKRVIIIFLKQKYSSRYLQVTGIMCIELICGNDKLLSLHDFVKILNSNSHNIFPIMRLRIFCISIRRKTNGKLSVTLLTLDINTKNFMNFQRQNYLQIFTILTSYFKNQKFQFFINNSNKDKIFLKFTCTKDINLTIVMLYTDTKKNNTHIIVKSIHLSLRAKSKMYTAP